MVAEAQRRVAHGLDIKIPILSVLSSASSVPKEFSEDVMRSDIIMNVRIAKETSEKLSTKKVKVELVKDAQHDILASKEVVRETTFDLIFDYFGWMVENVNVDDAGDDD